MLGGWFATALFAPFFFPGANLVLVCILGSIPALAMAIVYSKLSGVVPRSGGDYVWSSRVLGPLFGSIQFVLVYALTVILMGTIAISLPVTIWFGQFFITLGILNNNPAMIALGSSFGQSSVGYPVSIAIIVVCAIIAGLGPKLYPWFLRVATLIVYMATGVFIVLMFATDPSRVVSAFDHVMQLAGYSTTYSGIIQQTAAQGFSATEFNLGNTLLAAIPWGFFSFTGFNYGSYLAGETKNAKSSITRALLLSVLVTVIVLVTLSIGYYAVFGSTFINAVTFIASTNPSALPTWPTPNFIVSLANPGGVAFVDFSLWVNTLIVNTALILTSSRMLFAASFDGLLPRRLAEVNERFRSPVGAILVTALMAAIVVTISWYASFVAAWLNTSIVLPIAWTLPMIATFVLSVAMRERFGLTKRDAAAIAVSSLVGVGSFLFYAIAETFPLISGFYIGASLVYAYAAVVALAVVGAIVFVFARARMKAKGLDIRYVFREIPPE